MAKISPKPVYLILIALSGLGLYLTLSVFEVWAYLPFWIKNFALVLTIVGIYVFARRSLKKPTGPSYEISKPLLLGFSAILGVMIAGFIQAGPALPGRLIQAFTISLEQPPGEVLAELVITPPAHTNQDPVTLLAFADGAFSRKTLEGHPAFPEGSILTLKLKYNENTRPVFSLGEDWSRIKQQEDGSYVLQQVLKENSDLDVQVGPYVSIKGHLEAIEDFDPTIAFDDIPAVTGRQSLVFEANFSDDYGVREIYLEISGGGEPATLTRLAFPNRNRNEGSELFFVNLLGDPRAGSKVTGRLVAVDAIGQRAESGALVFDLPKKIFKNELAIEITGIRNSLLLNPEPPRPQVTRLGLLSESPEKFGGNKSVYLALRSVYWRLRSAETQRDIDEVARFLWQLALTLEEDASSEEQALRALLEEMIIITITGGDIRPFEQEATRLRAKANTLFQKEFGQTRRRFSFNSGVQGFEIPQVQNFRELTKILEREATENNRDEVLLVLLQARALFEEMGSLPRPGLSQS